MQANDGRAFDAGISPHGQRKPPRGEGGEPSVFLICAAFHEKTEVIFYDLSDQEILDYIRTGEPLDKAGAYGIQGKGALLVKRINGDYYNVVGMPVGALKQKLKMLL